MAYRSAPSPGLSTSRRALLAAAPLGAIALASCTTGQGVDLDSAGGSGVVPQFAAGIGGEPDQLDPHKTSAYFSFQVLENVFDTLVESDPDLEFTGALAKDWTVSDDELTWTFSMRENVTFHDGSPCTAKDVVYSYRRIIDDELANAWRFEAVEDVTAPDDLTVVITVSHPAPDLLANLGNFKGTAIVQKDNVESGKIADRPIGTGAFKVDGYRPGDRITLLAHDDFWGGRPKIDGVTVRFLSEGNTAQTALQNDEIQWTDAFAPQQARPLREAAGIEVAEVPSTDYWYLTLNEKNRPWDTVEARRALAFALDREGILKVTQYGAGEINQLAIPKSSPWYIDYEPFDHDPDEAQRLFDEIGYTGGELHFLATSEYPQSVTVAQLLADLLAPFGITVRIETVDFATFLDKQDSGDFDMLMMGWLGNNDPNDFYYNQHHSNGSSNAQGYSNPEVDDLLDKGRVETDEAVRKKLYGKAARIIADEASYIYLYNPAVIQAWRGDVHGYTTRSDGAVRFRQVSWQEES
jgi:peptide/nickel transport system substrate-binding protein